MGLEHLYERIITAALGALLGVCALLAGAKFIRNRAKVLSLLVRAHGALFAVMMGLMAMVGMFRSFGKLPQNYGIMELWNYGNEALGIDGEAQFHNASMSQSHNSIISESDISNGWRVVETRESREIVRRDSFAAPQIHTTWLARGGYKDKTRIAPYGWTFPWRDGILEGITVFSEGEFRVNVHTNYFPQPFGAPLAVVPSFNWNLLPGGVSNVFWYAVSPSNSLVVTWENSPVGLDVNCVTNFQAELFADGSFEYRYDDHTVGYSRVHPLDLDFDGLPNAIDPEPETPLGASVWNQSDAWAAAAFPSNAAEIASSGGYAAWVAQRASDPNRRLVRLNVALQGGRWPVCVDVGIVPVMADGSSDLLYAIDCGAQVPFSLSDGELASVLVRRTIPPSDFQTFIQADFQTSSFPHEWSVGDVTVHLDDPQAGWMRRTADVDVDDSELTHLHPGESAHLTAVVTNCHADAYLGCAWHGGKGISFSNPHSLANTLTYASSSTVQWATNNAYLVTSYAGGYSLTNTIWFTVGIEEEPTPCFTLGCQKVFFLNDVDFLNDGPCPTNRPERIRPVTLNLLGPYGTNGTVKLSAQGSASPVMFYIDNGVTNLITETTEIPLEVTDPFARTGTNTFYVSCPKKGTGTITATLELDGGGSYIAAAGFKCIEPLRQLVTTERTVDGHRFVNPSRLVMGTNAVLKVGVNGDFAATNVDWHVVSGPGKVVNTNGWYATVVATGMGEDVTVEARFNDDEIQPRFVLPVVEERVLHIKAFRIKPSKNESFLNWTDEEIMKHLDTANEIFSQVGIKFVLDEIRVAGSDDGEDWNLTSTQAIVRPDGTKRYRLTDQTISLLDTCQSNDCIKVFFLGMIRSAIGEKIAAFTIPLRNPDQGVFISRIMSNEFTLAHELGHAMGLEHCYPDIELTDDEFIEIERGALPVHKKDFPDGKGDWGAENGRGFYSIDDTRTTLLKRLVMYGALRDDKVDIPYGRIVSLTDSATNSASLWYPKVGERYLEHDNRKVYTHEK